MEFGLQVSAELGACVARVLGNEIVSGAEVVAPVALSDFSVIFVFVCSKNQEHIGRRFVDDADLTVFIFFVLRDLNPKALGIESIRLIGKIAIFVDSVDRVFFVYFCKYSMKGRFAFCFP